MRIIIFTHPDGGLSVVHPVRNTHGETLETDAEIAQRAWDRLPADAINPRWADASEIPADRTFRNAWEDDAGGLKVNMTKAREIHRTKLRELRKPKMEALDVAYMRADEIGDTAEKQRIAVQKQALRNVTADPAIEIAKTPEDLKVILLDFLK